MTKKNQQQPSESGGQQALTPYGEAQAGSVAQTAMIPADQVQSIVTAAVRAALDVSQQTSSLAVRTPPGRHAEDDVRMVLRTADFLLRACGIKLQGNTIRRADGAFYSDPSMIEGYRMLRQLMTAYGITEEPIEFARRPESPESFTDEHGVVHRTPHVDAYDDDAVLDGLEGGWGRR